MASERDQRWRAPTILAVVMSAAILGVALFSLSSEEVARGGERLEFPPEFQSCAVDEDCILLRQIGCCTCESGGARGAINAAQRDAWRLYIKRACRYRAVCVRVDSCQRDLAPACVSGRCVVKVIHG